MFEGPLLEFGFLFVDHSKLLVQDFVLRGCLTEEIDLMFKPFVTEDLFTSLGLCGRLLVVQDKTVFSGVTLILPMEGAHKFPSAEFLFGLRLGKLHCPFALLLVFLLFLRGLVTKVPFYCFPILDELCDGSISGNVVGQIEFLTPFQRQRELQNLHKLRLSELKSFRAPREKR